MNYYSGSVTCNCLNNDSNYYMYLLGSRTFNCHLSVGTYESQ